MLYLDNAATTPILPEVFEEMRDYFEKNYGNPEGKYYDLAIKSKEAIDISRKRISKFLKCETNEIIFNSGATEGNNAVIKGIIENYTSGTILTTKIEHSSIYETCKYAKLKGFNIKYIKVDEYGKIIFDDFLNLISSLNDIILVTIAYVNSELGTVQEIDKIAKKCYEKNILLHVDATQAVGKIDINLKKLKGISFLTFSSHKIFGPKGIGALIKQKNPNNEYYKLVPLIHGSTSINFDRPGTVNVPAIVGFGKACEIIDNNLDEIISSLNIKTNLLLNVFERYFGKKMIKNSKLDESLPGIINIRIKGINNEILLKSCKNIFAASTGSACSNLNPSRVLKAIGKNEIEISESIRISLSVLISDDDIMNIFE